MSLIRSGRLAEPHAGIVGIAALHRGDIALHLAFDDFGFGEIVFAAVPIFGEPVLHDARGERRRPGELARDIDQRVRIVASPLAATALV